MNEAKIFEEGQGQIVQSNKMIAKLESMGTDEPTRDFKKNRNMSTTSQNGPINMQGNQSPMGMNLTQANMGFSPQPNQMLGAQLMQQAMPQMQVNQSLSNQNLSSPNQNLANPNAISGNVGNPTANLGNPNMLQPTNNKITGQFPEPPKSPTMVVRVGEEHRLVIEGVRLAMEIIDSKLPNHMGYAHLLLSRTLGILNEVASRCGRKEVA